MTRWGHRVWKYWPKHRHPVTLEMRNGNKNYYSQSMQLRKDFASYRRSHARTSNNSLLFPNTSRKLLTEWSPIAPVLHQFLYCLALAKFYVGNARGYCTSLTMLSDHAQIWPGGERGKTRRVSAITHSRRLVSHIDLTRLVAQECKVLHEARWVWLVKITVTCNSSDLRLKLHFVRYITLTTGHKKFWAIGIFT